MTSLPARGEGVAAEAPKDPAELVEADPPVTFSVTARDGLMLWQRGRPVYRSGPRALAGIALRCLIAHLEGD